MRAIILSIGDEILNGQTLNTNAQWLGRKLNERSVEVIRSVTLADKMEDIQQELRWAIDTADWIFVTGGLGPTVDDITKKTLCDFFNVELVEHPNVLEHIEKIFHKRGRVMLDSNKQQAFLPSNAEVLFNNRGTAPGMLIKHKNSKLVFMPGVPFEMRGIMREHVLPRMDDEQKGLIVNRHYRVLGVAESILAERLKEVEEFIIARRKEIVPEGPLLNISIAYLPSPGQVKLRLTARGMDLDKMNTLLDKIDGMLDEHLGEDLLCRTQEDVADILQAYFIRKNLKFAVAESCTGGKIAALLVSKPGASAYFNGGLVAYSYDVKEELLGVDHDHMIEQGAVSEQVVLEMAEGVAKRLKADIALSVSGIAGPDGGTEDKPVGTVWVGLYINGEKMAQKFQFYKDRKVNLELSTIAALDYLRRNLKMA